MDDTQCRVRLHLVLMYLKHGYWPHISAFIIVTDHSLSWVSIRSPLTMTELLHTGLLKEILWLDCNLQWRLQPHKCRCFDATVDRPTELVISSASAISLEAGEKQKGRCRHTWTAHHDSWQQICACCTSNQVSIWKLHLWAWHCRNRTHWSGVSVWVGP